MFLSQCSDHVQKTGEPSLITRHHGHIKLPINLTITTIHLCNYVHVGGSLVGLFDG